MDWYQKIQYEKKGKKVASAVGQEIAKRELVLTGDPEDSLFVARLTDIGGNAYKDFVFKDNSIMSDTEFTVHLAFLKIDEAVDFVLARLMNQGLVEEKKEECKEN